MTLHRRDKVRGKQHVQQAIRERRVEDHRPPVLRHEPASIVHPVSGGRLHPAVDRENPERRHEGAEPIRGPMTGPAWSENTLQLVPNCQLMTMPETTPMPKATAA
jgi:hypothetical protein